ncbi:MAG: MFS transporter [bacterium]|nr:MFS transporter [bacterium]
MGVSSGAGTAAPARQRIGGRPSGNLPILLTMCAGYFLVLLDVTIVNIALPSLGRDLHATVDELQWVVDGYAVLLASLTLICGTLGDRLGHKRIVLSGLALFGLASLGCALAPGASWLVGGRVAQGVGAALLFPGTLAIINRTYDGAAGQARAIGIWAAVGSLALPAGPLLGGALVQWLGWRSIFLLNLPLLAVALPAAALLVREEPPARARRLDPAGAAAGALFLGCLTFAFIQAGRAGTRAPQVGVAAAAAVALGAAFVLLERRAADPMLPLPLFRRPAFTVANVAAGTMNLGTLGMLFVVTQYLQDVQGRAPLAAGLTLLPAFLPLVVLSPLAGRVAGRIGPRVPVAVGLLVAGAGLGAMVTLEVRTPIAAIVPVFLAWGVGLAVLTPSVVSAAMGAVSRERSGLASGVNNTARQAGGAIGIAAFGALAGSVARPQAFLAGMHAGGLVAGALYGLVGLLSLAVLPGSLRGRAR